MPVRVRTPTRGTVTVKGAIFQIKFNIFTLTAGRKMCQVGREIVPRGMSKGKCPTLQLSATTRTTLLVLLQATV